MVKHRRSLTGELVTLAKVRRARMKRWTALDRSFAGVHRRAPVPTCLHHPFSAQCPVDAEDDGHNNHAHK